MGSYTREQVKKVFAPHFCEEPLEQLLDLLDFEATAEIDTPEQSFVEKFAFLDSQLYCDLETGKKEARQKAQLIEEMVERKIKEAREQITEQIGTANTNLRQMIMFDGKTLKRGS